MRSVLALAALLTTACGAGAGGGDDDDDGTDAGNGGDRPELPANAAVFVQTATELYRLDPISMSVTLVAPFTGDAAGDSITDIAVDSEGQMIGISFTTVYRIDSQTAVTQHAGTGTLPEMLQSLSFVPRMLAFGVEGPDVLVGSRMTDGVIFQIDPATAQETAIGDMGGGYQTDGDIVAVRDFGMVATVGDPFSFNQLVRLAPNTFAATPIGTDTGWQAIWGLGFWQGTLYGFSSDGDFVTIDTTTGAASYIETTRHDWWGAAVTTVAPIAP